MEFVKCALKGCGEDTDVRVEWPHGGAFFCPDHMGLVPAIATGSGPAFSWARSQHQAELDKGGWYEVQ